MNIKKLFKILFLSCLFFVASSFFATMAFAQTIFFDPATASSVVGTDTQINVKIDTAQTSIFGADATINYPTDGLTVKSITNGGFFSDWIIPIQNPGQIIIRGSFFSSVSGLGSGTGTFATITFTSLKAAGTGTVGFTCSGSGNDTDIITANGSNVLNCGSLNQSVLSFSTGATATPVPTNAPGGTQPTNASTNACGGTCGSVYNCNVNLFCYQGYCRNPDCPSSSTCGCTTPSPTPAPTQRPVYSKTPQPTITVVALAKFTPFPSPQNVESPTPAAKATQFTIKPLYFWAGLIGAAIIVILIAISALRKKSPPKFNPPTTNVPPIFPTNPPSV